MDKTAPDLLVDLVSAIDESADLIAISRLKLAQIGMMTECADLDEIVVGLRTDDGDPCERVRVAVPSLRKVADLLRDRGFLITSDALRMSCVIMATAADRLLTTTQVID